VGGGARCRVCIYLGRSRTEQLREAPGGSSLLKTGQRLNWTKSRPSAQCWWWPRRTQTPWGHPPQGTVPRAEGPAEDPVGRGAEGAREVEVPLHNSAASLPTGGAARRYWAFLSTTDAGAERAEGSRGKRSGSGVRGSGPSVLLSLSCK